MMNKELIRFNNTHAETVQSLLYHVFGSSEFIELFLLNPFDLRKAS